MKRNHEIVELLLNQNNIDINIKDEIFFSLIKFELNIKWFLQIFMKNTRRIC